MTLQGLKVIVMNKKGISKMIIAAIIIVIIFIAGIAAYSALNHKIFDEIFGDIFSENGGDGDPSIIEDANSLQFEVDLTSQETTTKYKLTGKNLRAEDMKIRIDMLDGDTGNFSYILNPGEQEAWTKIDSTWMDLSGDFAAQWDSWGLTWLNYTENLQNWSGTGDWSYNAPNGDLIRIYNISVNPVISDSLFQPT